MSARLQLRVSPGAIVSGPGSPDKIVAPTGIDTDRIERRLADASGRRKDAV